MSVKVAIVTGASSGIGAAQINEVAERMQREFIARFGIVDVISTRT
jgi:NADP-dependent 3-hydroxy acid dehydrogenase YdfG